MADFKIECDTVVPPLPTTERGVGFHLGGTMKKEPRLLYCANNIVVQRNIEKVNQVRLNPEHSVRVLVAKFSPNGEWVCSGDTSGQTVVWAHESFVVKNTITVGKKVLDVAWSQDGQRIVAVGDGKDDKGKVFPWNTNNKLGELGGAQGAFYSCDFKPNRPFRVVTSAQDYAVYCYSGPPFKFETYEKKHTNYVNCVRYSPDGAFYVSVGSDKKVLVFDGKTGKLVREIADGKGKNEQHTGTIYSVSFSPDGKHFLTASADRTCKVWDFEQGTVVHTYTFADKPTKFDMQQSCLWLAKDVLVSVSFSGRINYLDPEMKEQRPVRILTGHNTGINDVSYDATNNTVYTCDGGSRVVRTECKSGDCEDMLGMPHKEVPIRFARCLNDGSAFYTIATDDSVCKTPTNGNQMSDKLVKTDGAVRDAVIANNSDLLIVGTHRNKLQFIKDLNIEQTVDIDFTPTCMAISPDDKYIAVGRGGNNLSVVIYAVDDFKEVCTVKNDQFIRGEPNNVEFSSDGKFIAVSDKTRNIWIWDVESQQFDQPVNAKKSMKFHDGMVSSLHFNAENMLLTCGHDGTLFVFPDCTKGENKYFKLERACIGLVRKAIWISNRRICAIGNDQSIRFYTVSQ
jgi:WD40 repeat protein